MCLTTECQIHKVKSDINCKEKTDPLLPLET